MEDSPLLGIDPRLHATSLKAGIAAARRKGMLPIDETMLTHDPVQLGESSLTARSRAVPAVLWRRARFATNEIACLKASTRISLATGTGTQAHALSLALPLLFSPQPIDSETQIARRHRASRTRSTVSGRSRHPARSQLEEEEEEDAHDSVALSVLHVAVAAHWADSMLVSDGLISQASQTSVCAQRTASVRRRKGGEEEEEGGGEEQGEGRRERNGPTCDQLKDELNKMELESVLSVLGVSSSITCNRACSTCPCSRAST